MSEAVVKPNNGSVLGTEDIGRLMRKFSIPAIISGLVSAAYNIVDQVFIGQGVGDLGMAATNVAFPLVTISTALALLFGVGGASSFNLNMGRGKPEAASKVAGNAIIWLVLSGILVGVLATVFLRPLLFFFGGTESIMPFAEPYTLITNIGIPFLVFSTGISHLIRADGSPTASMMVMLSGAIFNLIFDPVFLFVFHMGIEGIALATLLGQVLSSAVGVAYLLRRFKTVPLKKEHFKIDWVVTRVVCSLGTASCFNQLAMTVVQIVKSNTLRHYGALSEYGSEIPLAAVGATTKVLVVLMAVVIGIAQGCQPILSYNYGAKNYDRVKTTYRKALLYSTLISVVAFLCFQLFPRQIMGIFGSSSELFYEYSVRYMRIFMMLTFLNGLQPITSNFFTSIGKATMGFWMSLTRQILLLTPLLLILPLFWGMDGVFLTGPISDGVSAALAAIFGIREMKKLTALQAGIQNPQLQEA